MPMQPSPCSETSKSPSLRCFIVGPNLSRWPSSTFYLSIVFLLPVRRGRQSSGARARGRIAQRSEASVEQAEQIVGAAGFAPALHGRCQHGEADGREQARRGV